MAVAYADSGAFNATATSGEQLALACPTTVNAGDLLIASTAIRITNRGMAPDSTAQADGWVTWRGNTTSYSASGPVGRHFIHAKIADGTEGGTTVNFDVLNAGTPDNASTTPRHGFIHRFTGNASGTIADETDGDVLAGFLHVNGNNTVIQDAGVTTDEADCLAVNLVYVSDDTAPFGSFTGETGGDWVHGTEGETSLGSDGAQMLQTATMASAGTIDGGTYTMSGAGDPFSTFGFFIKPAAGGGTEIFGAVNAPFTFTPVVTGKQVAQAAVASPFSTTFVVAGKNIAHGAVVTPITFSEVVAGLKTAQGAVASPFVLGIVTEGSVPGSTVFGDVVAAFTVTPTIAGTKTAQGAVLLPEVFNITAAVVKTAQGASALPIALTPVITGQKSTFGASDLVLTLGFTTTGSIVGELDPDALALERAHRIQQLKWQRARRTDFRRSGFSRYRRH